MPVHDNLTPDQVRKIKKLHPEAVFLAHPECRPEVLDLADEIRSTSGMIAHAINSDRQEFIIGTETGILYPLSKAAPSKLFIPADPDMVCADMKKTRLRNVFRALEDMKPEVKVPEDVRIRAKDAVERMLVISGQQKGA